MSRSYSTIAAHESIVVAIFARGVPQIIASLFNTNVGNC